MTSHFPTSRRRARTREGLAANTVGIAIAVIFMVPVLWLAISAFKPVSALGDFPPELLPIPATLANFDAAFGPSDFGSFLMNSVIVGILSTVIVVCLGLPAAYGLSRTSMRGRAATLTGLLVISVFPVIATIPPLYVSLRALGWLNSYEALVLPYVAFNLPLAIWTMRNSLLSISHQMEEAAEVDGASTMRTIVQIIVPQALPGIFVAAVLTFVACWQEFLMALSFNSNPTYQTAPVGIALFGGAFQLPYGTIFAASLVALLPILVLVIALRRWVVGGLSTGSVKG
ncbi:carbohydrate ABC transporter permease [Sinomonas susongensis]|uniref:carbohydrate ABC transporter permease n=1 Tax=Sinomonas susongensis TaxID=1324851 RepID=UPI001FE8F389|nr:carbohydrate ABC transporter permease [Sinomonas susongensis]